MSCLEIISAWLVALGTLILAAVAVLQETIRGWFYRPIFRVSTKTEAPDCVAVPFTKTDGTFVADSIYLRLWIENTGNATAKNAEVYAQELRRKRLDGKWERVREFPPMNLRWANIGTMYFPNIVSEMGKHCDLGHIADPALRHLLGEVAPGLDLSSQQTSLAFDVIAPPNNKGHIIPDRASTNLTSSLPQKTFALSKGPLESRCMEHGTPTRRRCYAMEWV